MRDEGQELPAGCILLSPWLDLGRDRRAVPDPARRDVMLSPAWLDACARAYADPAAWADQLVSPLRAAHSGLPPLLIQAGTRELLAPDAGLLAASASAAGTDVTYTSRPSTRASQPSDSGENSGSEESPSWSGINPVPAGQPSDAKVPCGPLT